MISVIVTTYNGSEFIIEQLSSIKNQTRVPDEVIISDDGSTDDTLDLVSNYIRDNNLSNWVVRQNKQNKGWRRNFIETAQEAKGDFIFFSDQDDVWMTDKIEIMSGIMQENEQINVLAGGYIKFVDVCPEYEKNNNFKIRKVQSKQKVLKTSYPGCVYCVRKEYFMDVTRNWNGLFSHDAICWASAKMLGGLYLLDRPVIFWRRHANSTYTRTGELLKTKTERIRYIETQIKNCECLSQYISDKSKDKKSITRVERYHKFLERRLHLMVKRSVSDVFWLIFHVGYYNKKRQLLLELYLSKKSS